ncbi:MAG: cell filamentation protein Fic, partial [Boseongicola sp. SB0677_bin_26]|nr:cell filamentation protein Fic [Boseongicola sp. SB0677_bin_26]
ISIPAARLQDFNEKMVRFHTDKDATEMMRFLIECQPKNAP